MSYDNFSFSTAKAVFNLTTIEDRPAIPHSQIESDRTLALQQIIDENLPLAIAIGTEKARSELLIAPVLVEVRKLLDRRVSLFSGVEFNVDSFHGLTGICDFLISTSPEQYAIEAPVLVLVEAKKADLNAGMGQVVAEMVAAQKFNRIKKNQVDIVYGCITNGAQWRFLNLRDRILTIDPEDRNLKPLAELVGSIVTIFDD